ncbi:MAG: sel1 repeat family protein, partial [Magnetococcales bacterium]|nr:sel1 repeat family protein [Magnetococcales bacterium]
MNRWFIGVIEARTSFWLSPDRLYRIYLAQGLACFVRVGGQRLSLRDELPWLLQKALNLLGTFNSSLEERLTLRLYRLLQGRDEVDDSELDEMTPEQLLARHPQNFIVDLDKVEKLHFERPFLPLLWGNHAAVLRFVDQNGFSWRLLLEEDIQFLAALGLLPPLLGEKLVMDEVIAHGFSLPNMQFLLGCGYEFGHHLPKSLADAMAWYQIAAARDYAPAQCRLALFHQKGMLVEQNFQTAHELCNKAVEQDYAPALTLLGEMYEQGQGVEKDVERALSLYQQAAERDENQAMYLLGCKYEQGDGVLRNYTEAKNWYSRAAERDHGMAQLALANLLSRGVGLDKDYQAAAF